MCVGQYVLRWYLFHQERPNCLQIDTHPPAPWFWSCLEGNMWPGYINGSCPMVVVSYTESDTQSCRQFADIFKFIFLNETSDFTKICYQGVFDIIVNTGSGYDVAPNRRQVITWTNDDPIQWRHMAFLCHRGLIQMVSELGRDFESKGRRSTFSCV